MGYGLGFPATLEQARCDSEVHLLSICARGLLSRTAAMRFLILLATFEFASALGALAAASPFRLTEFAATGHQGLRDEDGDTPDWIEIQNISAERANLAEWSLTDDFRRPDRWRFPETNLPPGGFLLVFASGKDRRSPGRPLHTDFKLDAKGGNLRLASPSGDVSKVENYPPQVAGISFGLIGSGGTEENRRVLIGPDSNLNFYLPLTDRLGTNWIMPGFDDSRWRRGQNGIGYATRGNGFQEFLQTDVGAMMAGRSVGLYVRFPFVVTNEFNRTGLELHVQYDDGFVAWLNGLEIARRNAPEKLNRESASLATRRHEPGFAPERIPLDGAAVRLVAGTNWLAVHVLNASLESSDLLFRATLDAPQSTPQAISSVAPVYSYLMKPTPGRPNSSAVSTGPRILSATHRPSPRQPGADEPIDVTAKVAPFNGPVAEVRLRYRVMFGNETELPMHDDGQHGDGAAGDGVYGAAIPAKVATPGQMIRYCVLAKNEAGQMSRWPLFANRREYSAYQGTVMANPAIQTRLPVIHLFTSNNRAADAGMGRNPALFYEGELYDNVTIAIHGQISRGFPKASYNLDFPRDRGFRYQTNHPRVSDLKLLANFADKSKIRNTLAYEMIAAAGCIGHFAFPVRLQRNGQFFSVAEVVEDGDDRWLERVGRDPGGALYKMYDNLNGGHGAEKKTRRHEDTRDLAAFAGALAEGRPLTQRAAYAYDHIDLPQCVSYFVAMALISSGDHGHKNYYLYRDTRGSGEWALLPWDVDLSWGRNWMGEYFNENIFVDNPLNLYRAGHDKGRNRLYNLIFEHPDFRQMYLRRLRTVMDELLQPPGTPQASLMIERRVRKWMDLLDPPEFKKSDADLDDAAWPNWGTRSSMRAEAQRILDEYLPGRRNFLFKSSRAKLLRDPIPSAQPADMALQFGEIDLRCPPTEQFVCITNRNDFAIDVTGWQLTGAGVEHRFRPGTVVPAGKSIYAVSNVSGFRRRAAGPSGGQSLLAQGNWKVDARNGRGVLRLLDGQGRVVATGAGPPTK